MNYRINELDEKTFMIIEGEGPASVYMYLLIGDESAVLIDAGYGSIELDKICREMTDKKISVILTHGHVDHIGGAYLFEKVYLNSKDIELYYSHTSPTVRKAFGVSEDLPVVQEFLELKENMKFDLGNRTLSIIETPGHSAGSVCVLDRERKWLFTGDTCCKAHVLLCMENSTDVTVYSDSISKLISRGAEYTVTYPGHHSFPVEKEVLAWFKEACKELISGEAMGEITDFPFGKARLFEYKDIGIVCEDR